MARTLIGLVYNTATMMARRIEILEPGEDDAVLDQIAARLPVGFAIAKAPIASLASGTSAIVAGKDTTLASVIAAVQAAGGPKIIPQPRCVEIDLTQNVVTDAYLADTSVWSVKGKNIVPHPTAGIGWAYNPILQTLTSPPLTINGTLQPATVVTIGTVTQIGTVGL